MNFFNRHNLKAAGIHLAISALIAMLSLTLVYGLWYPAPLDTALEVRAIFLLLLGIDITLGPLLTLVVYKPEKSSLKFDLAVIACLQFAALIYGLHTVGSARPAYMVFTKDRFDLVLAYEVANVAGSKAQPSLIAQSPWAQPLLGYTLAGANIPTQPEDFPLLNALTSSALNGGPDIPNVVEMRTPYAQALPKIQATALPLVSFKPSKPKHASVVSLWQSKYPAGSSIVPLKIKFTIYTVVLNPKNGQILGIEPVNVF